MLVCHGESNRMQRKMDGFENYLENNRQQNLGIQWVKETEVLSMIYRWLACGIRDRKIH